MPCAVPLLTQPGVSNRDAAGFLRMSPEMLEMIYGHQPDHLCGGAEVVDVSMIRRVK